MSMADLSIDDILVAKMCAALRVELPAIVRDAVREELKRAELPPEVSPARYVELSSLSPSTVRRRISDGTIASRKIGGRVLVSTATLKVVDELEIARAATKAIGG